MRIIHIFNDLIKFFYIFKCVRILFNKRIAAIHFKSEGETFFREAFFHLKVCSFRASINIEIMFCKIIYFFIHFAFLLSYVFLIIHPYMSYKTDFAFYCTVNISVFNSFSEFFKSNKSINLIFITVPSLDENSISFLLTLSVNG